jgi:hypothetical protein
MWTELDTAIYIKYLLIYLILAIIKKSTQILHYKILVKPKSQVVVGMVKKMDVFLQHLFSNAPRNKHEQNELVDPGMQDAIFKSCFRVPSGDFELSRFITSASRFPK